MRLEVRLEGSSCNLASVFGRSGFGGVVNVKSHPAFRYRGSQVKNLSRYSDINGQTCHSFELKTNSGVLKSSHGCSCELLKVVVAQQEGTRRQLLSIEARMNSRWSLLLEEVAYTTIPDLDKCAFWDRRMLQTQLVLEIVAGGCEHIFINLAEDQSQHLEIDSCTATGLRSFLPAI